MANTIEARAATLDIVLEEGAGLTISMTKYDKDKNFVDLSGYTGRLTVRRSLSSPTTLLELTTANAKIVLGTAALDNIKLIFSEADVIAAAAVWTSGLYNFYLTPASGDSTREISGTITIAEGT